MPADTDSKADTDTPKSKGRGCSKMLTIGVLVVVVLLIVARVLIGMRTSNSVKAELDLLKAAGAPMTIAELLGPDPAPKENAASDLEAAFIAMTRGSGDPYFPNKARGTDGPAAEALYDAVGLPLAERLAIYQANLDDPDLLEALAALEDAAAKPHCRFDMDWDRGPFISLNYLSPARAAARLLAADALAKAASGDEAAAWARIHQGLILAHHIGETPMVLPFLLAIACENIALKAALDMQPWIHGPLPDWLLAENSRFDMFTDPTNLVAAVDGERLRNSSFFFDNLASSASKMSDFFDSEDSIGSLLIVYCYTSGPLRPWRDTDKRTYLYLARSVRENLVSRTFDPDVLTLNRFADEVPNYYVFTRMNMIFLGSSLSHGRAFLRGRLLRLALFACDYRRRTGAFPASLDELVKALPPGLAAVAKDPAMVTPEQPLTYRVEGDGITLYGFGRDGNDDGGDPELDVVITANLSLPPPVESSEAIPEPEEAPADYPSTDDID